MKGWIIYGNQHFANIRSPAYEPNMDVVDSLEWSRVDEIETLKPLIFNTKRAAEQRLKADDKHYELKFHYNTLFGTDMISHEYQLLGGEAKVIKYKDLLIELAEEKLRQL